MTENNTSQKQTPPHDDFSIRCPRLGHQITFAYCCSENHGNPCFKTLDCWFNYFDVHAYLEQRMSPEDFKKIFIDRPKPKILSLVELIEQAKKRRGQKD